METPTTNPQMSEAAQQTSSPVAPAGGGQRAKVGIMPVFSTWIYHCQDGPKHLNERLEELTQRLRLDPRNGTQRTNTGGWHYAFDLFELKEPVVAEFHNRMTQHVQAFLNHFRLEERKKKDQFRLRGWINVNRAGNFNLRHCHPGCFISATYYVRVPEGMNGGEIRSSAALGFHAPSVAQGGAQLRKEAIVIVNPVECRRTEDHVESATEG